MVTAITVSPGALDFGGVPPGSAGPDISVDPSFPPWAINFAGGAQIAPVPTDAQVTARIEPAGTPFAVRDVIVLNQVLEEVDPGELPPGHHGPPPKVRVWEAVDQSDGVVPLAVKAGQHLLVRVMYAVPATGGDFVATLVIQGDTWEPARVPLRCFLGEIRTLVLASPLLIRRGETADQAIVIDCVAGLARDVQYALSPQQLDSGVSLLPSPTAFRLEAGEVRGEVLHFAALAEAPLGSNTLFLNQFDYRRQGLLVPVEIRDLVPPPPPPQPDPRVDHFDAVYVERSTDRICQLTGTRDPENKPHPNNTAGFDLFGTDLGTSFDHVVDGERRTYFFFGDTHTSGAEEDGDPIAYTTDEHPEPDGLHLQFIMGDNQWRRLSIPGIALGNFEVPSGGFSHAGRLFVFATTGVLRTGDATFMENSVLASAADAHDSFDLCYFVSRRDDSVDTPKTGGKFINVAAFKIRNDDWPGLPSDAVRGGEGLILAGTGCYRRSAPYLAYLPLPPGGIPQRAEWRYLSGFFFWEPGFGPSGPPNWSAAESDASPLFDDMLGEISLSWNEGLGRWLMSYGGCAAAGCGIVVRSAPMPWGPWSEPQLFFNTERERAGGVYMFESGPYGAYLIPRYDVWDAARGEATIYYTMSNGDVVGDPNEPRYQVHLMKSTLRLVSR